MDTLSRVTRISFQLWSKSWAAEEAKMEKKWSETNGLAALIMIIITIISRLIHFFLSIAYPALEWKYLRSFCCRCIQFFVYGVYLKCFQFPMISAACDCVYSSVILFYAKCIFAQTPVNVLKTRQNWWGTRNKRQLKMNENSRCGCRNCEFLSFWMGMEKRSERKI